jgi:molybdopterin molybdotransferase
MTPMLDVAAAREIVLRHAKPLTPRAEPLGPEVLGEVLAEDVAADIDSPPFDKSMMDGYAVRTSDLLAPGIALRVVDEVQAGSSHVSHVGLGEAVRIFTGAPIPISADAVVKQEDTTTSGSEVVIQKGDIPPGLNIMPRGQEMKAGQVVLPAGTVITPFALGVLAAVGRRSAVLGRPPNPHVGVLSTGNELVDAIDVPRGGQIRNTNGPMLRAMASRAGAKECDFGIYGDDREGLKNGIFDGFHQDILILSGGVSVGKYDLVPDVLKSLGVEIHFHTVRMKPGKPLLFGTKDDTLVFGLPGNPVSAAVGFELFVRPAIDIMCGRTPGPKELRLPLSEPLKAKHDRPTYHPAVIGPDTVRPLPWQGSADLRALLPANGYIVLPPGEVSFAAGDVVPVIDTR